MLRLVLAELLVQVVLGVKVLDEQVVGEKRRQELFKGNAPSLVLLLLSGRLLFAAAAAAARRLAVLDLPNHGQIVLVRAYQIFVDNQALIAASCGRRRPVGGLVRVRLEFTSGLTELHEQRGHCGSSVIHLCLVFHLGEQVVNDAPKSDKLVL